MIDDPAVRRTLRLAIGVSLALAIGQAINWSANSITAIIVSGLLTLPLPAPSLRLALSIVAKIGVSLLVGVLLLVPSLEQPLLGLFLVAVLLFATSWLASTGKIGPLDFTLLAMGLLIIPAIGATDIHLGVAAAKGVFISSLVVFPCVWVAYAILPEPLFHKIPVPPPAFDNIRDAAIHALRPVVVVMPVYLWFFLAHNTYSYAVVLLKAVLIAQQAENSRGMQLAKDELMATLVGGAVAVVVWELLSIWPSLFWYVVLTFLSALVLGQQIFGGKGGRYSTHMWGYAFTTSIVINASAVLASGFGDHLMTGDQRYFQRVGMFLFVTLYGMLAIYTVDAWLDRRRAKRRAARERRARRDRRVAQPAAGGAA
jgi:hypothetical protein